VPQAPVAIPVAASAAAQLLAHQQSLRKPLLRRRNNLPHAVAPTPQIPPIVPGVPTSGQSLLPLAKTPASISPKCLANLNRIFESGSSHTEEDPETHYNLGDRPSAKWGLLDEAIGRGCKRLVRPSTAAILSRRSCRPTPGSRNVSSIKSVPEAAIRWYQKALAVATIDEDTRTALHYELGGLPTKPPAIGLPPSSTSWKSTAATSTIATLPSASSP